MSAKERLTEYIERDEIYQDYKKDKLMYASDFDKFCIEHCKDIEELLEENQELQKQLEYLRSGEYYNQLRFEREMLEHIVEHGEVSKEDKAFIDMTHRNTELLEQQKEFIKYLEDEITELLKEYGNYVYDNYSEEKGKYDTCIEILQKYKEIIGYKDE